MNGLSGYCDSSCRSAACLESSGIRIRKFSAKTAQAAVSILEVFLSPRSGLLLEVGTMGVKDFVADVLGFPEIDLERQCPDQICSLIQPLHARNVVRLFEKLFGPDLEC